MSEPKQEKDTDGQILHYSAGAVIARDGTYLLIDRAVPPPGFAGPAGHVDEGETPEEALVREVKEETGLDVTDFKLLFEEELDWNRCSRGVDRHYWYLYACTVSGTVERSEEETKSAGWYTVSDIQTLSLEPVWEYWFKKLKVI